MSRRPGPPAEACGGAESLLRQAGWRVEETDFAPGEEQLALVDDLTHQVVRWLHDRDVAALVGVENVARVPILHTLTEEMPPEVAVERLVFLTFPSIGSSAKAEIGPEDLDGRLMPIFDRIRLKLARKSPTGRAASARRTST